MIITHVTVLGPTLQVHFTRLTEPSLHVLIETSDLDGSNRVALWSLDSKHSLADLYTHVGPLFYGEGLGRLENWQRAEIEDLIRPLLRHRVSDF